MSDWETELLQEVDYYKKVLLDGCTIKNRDVEMCDLRLFVDRYSGIDHKPMIQVYKANKGGKEYIEMFHNFEQAYRVFKDLIKNRGWT